MPETMPVPTKKRVFELAAQFLQNDLDDMRKRAVAQWESQQLPKQCPQGCKVGSAVNPNSEGCPSPCAVCKGTAQVEWDGREYPLGSSHEGDLMKAVEWATALATLRMLAEQEER